MLTSVPMGLFTDSVAAARRLQCRTRLVSQILVRKDKILLNACLTGCFAKVEDWRVFSVVQNCVENRSMTAFNRAGFRHRRKTRLANCRRFTTEGTEGHGGKSKSEKSGEMTKVKIKVLVFAFSSLNYPPRPSVSPVVTKFTDLKIGLPRPTSGRSCYGGCELSRIPP